MLQHDFFDVGNITDTPPAGVNAEEELRPLVFDGVTYPAYSVSNWGNVYTHKTGRMVDRRRATPVPITRKDGEVNGRGGASYVSLTLKNGVTKSITVHKLVMSTFRPIDEYPPSQIPLEDFMACPETVKRWIRKTVVINHIDHDCHNNRVENLEYTTQHDNTLKAVKHHGGNLNNKNTRKR